MNLSECQTVEDYLDYYIYPTIATKAELRSMLKHGRLSRNHKKAIEALLSPDRKLVISLHKANK